MSLLRKPPNPILQSYNSLKINMRFQENFGKKTFRRGLNYYLTITFLAYCFLSTITFTM